MNPAYRDRNLFARYLTPESCYVASLILILIGPDLWLRTAGASHPISEMTAGYHALEDKSGWI